MKRLALPLSLLLTGCAGIGLIATSNPYRKLAQADYLMSQERMAMAEVTIQEALDIFEKNGDALGAAEAHHSFGNLYKNDAYHGKRAEFFKQAGTYDATYTKSIDRFEKSMSIFETHADEAGVVKCLIGIGNAYGLRGERDASCGYYQQALARYNQAKRSGKLTQEPALLNPNYKNMGELIEAFLKYECGFHRYGNE